MCFDGDDHVVGDLFFHQVNRIQCIYKHFWEIYKLWEAHICVGNEEEKRSFESRMPVMR